MRTLLALAFAAVTSLAMVAPAHSDSPQEAARRLHEAAQFDRARAAEFNKLAGEDEGVAQSRARQAADLDNNAIKYSERANFHRALAAQFGNNADQLRLARECDALATSLHNIANERRSIVTSLQNHVIQWRTWSQNLQQRAANQDAVAARLQSGGML